MSEKPPFSEGLLAQCAIVCAALFGLAIVGSILTALGAEASLLSVIFIMLVLVVTAVTANRALMPFAAGQELILCIEALSAFGLFGIVGAAFAYGHDGLAIMIGLAAGLVLSLLLIAPRFSAIPVSSLSDFLSARYRSEPLRILGLAVMAVVSMLFIAAQLVASGLIASQGLGIAPIGGILIGAIVILIIMFPLQSVIVIDAAESLSRLDTQFGQPGGTIGHVGVFSLILCLAVGTAVMPHIFEREGTQGSPAKTEGVLRRGLILFVILATALPALGVLGYAALLNLFSASNNTLDLDAIPNALLIGGEICGGAATEMYATCAAQGYGRAISADAIVADPQSVLLALPSLLGASDWLLALLSFVGLSVAGVAGAAATNSLAQSFASRALDSEAGQIKAVVAFAVTSVAGIVAVSSEIGLITLAAWAYSLIAAALVGPLILGLWWRRTNAVGALAGLLSGFVLTALYIFGSYWGFDLKPDSGDEWRWLGLSSLMAGTFGIVLSVIVTALVSLVGPKPRPSQLAFLLPIAQAPKANPEVLE